MSQLCDHSYSAKVAEEIVVLDDPGLVSRHASATTTNEKPAATKSGGSAQPRSVQPTYRDAFKHFRAKKGFCEKAAAVYASKSVRDSTRNINMRLSGMGSLVGVHNDRLIHSKLMQM